MVKYNVLHTLVAQNDLKDIAVYIAFDNSFDVAEKIVADIQQAINNLSAFPLLGMIPKSKVAQKQNYKYIIVGNYNVYYKIQEDVIYIMRIRHSAIDLTNQI